MALEDEREVAGRAAEAGDEEDSASSATMSVSASAAPVTSAGGVKFGATPLASATAR